MVSRIIANITNCIQNYLLTHQYTIDKYDILKLKEDGKCLIERGEVKEDGDYYLLSFLTLNDEELWSIDGLKIVEVAYQYYGLE